MTTQENIIALAEFVGWEWQRLVDMPTDHRRGQWLSPDTGWSEVIEKSAIPFNPYTSADDCEAVIRKLRDKHITVTVTFGRGVRFNHDNGTSKEWEGDDWKRYVCDGTLEVI